MKKYIQGEKVSFTVQLAVKGQDGLVRPFDLTGNAEITMIWKSGASVIKKNRVAADIGVVVVGLDTGGKVKGTLMVADTDAQPQTTAGLIEIDVDFGGGNVEKFQIKSGFAVALKADAA